MKSEILNRKSKIGFTLIELLVVVTIIVVLLALLVPALDKALYQAELTVCGANMKSLGTAMVQYAAGNQRRYIARYVRTPVGTRPNLLRIGGGAPEWADDRPILEQHASLGLLVDPLAGDIRLDKASNDQDPYIYTSVILWAGWVYDGQKGMTKLGDRFTCVDGVTEPATPRQYRYNVLASDLDWGFTDGRQIGVSHPDDEGLLSLKTLQNETPNESLPGLPVANAPHTLSSWEQLNKATRGKVDLNYAMDDGSVLRLDKLERFDPRTRSLWLTSSQDFQYSFWLPPVER